MEKVLGRPRKEDPKSKVVTMKMNNEELERLREYAEKHNMNVTEVIKKGLDLVYENSED
jgi:hypothetical protein